MENNPSIFQVQGIGCPHNGILDSNGNNVAVTTTTTGAILNRESPRAFLEISGDVFGCPSWGLSSRSSVNGGYRCGGMPYSLSTVSTAPHLDSILLSPEATAVSAERPVAMEISRIWIPCLPCLSVPCRPIFQLPGHTRLENCHMIPEPLEFPTHYHSQSPRRLGRYVPHSVEMDSQERNSIPREALASGTLRADHGPRQPASGMESSDVSTVT